MQSPAATVDPAVIKSRHEPIKCRELELTVHNFDKNLNVVRLEDAIHGRACKLRHLITDITSRASYPRVTSYITSQFDFRRRNGLNSSHISDL